ncbi:calcium-binding protein 39 [Corchorus olitorius]|uniref:Calcium-binding protein 39 n=1 Tax=Corchorus olitorius TaxID=93759 RepID=A0A1R3K9B5_9ROSI|nr:calcium-binding protein 39 [Corchorus olitorius]
MPLKLLESALNRRKFRSSDLFPSRPVENSVTHGHPTKDRNKEESLHEHSKERMEMREVCRENGDERACKDQEEEGIPEFRFIPERMYVKPESGGGKMREMREKGPVVIVCEVFLVAGESGRLWSQSPGKVQEREVIERR